MSHRLNVKAEEKRDKMKIPEQIPDIKICSFGIYIAAPAEAFKTGNMENGHSAYF